MFNIFKKRNKVCESNRFKLCKEKTEKICSELMHLSEIKIEEIEEWQRETLGAFSFGILMGAVLEENLSQPQAHALAISMLKKRGCLFCRELNNSYIR